jgi:hypothetical protein
MSSRLHSAVKYEVNYGSKSNFNYKSEKINPIINILAENDCWYEGDDLGYATFLTANRKYLLSNVDKIINPDETWEWQEELNEYVEYLETGDDAIDREYLHENLKMIIEQSDSNKDEVYFAWF